MHKKYLLLLILLTCTVGYGQFLHKNFFKTTDTVQKVATYKVQRTFKEDLKTKYSGKDFKYKEEKLKKKSNSKPPAFLVAFVTAIGVFLAKIFPFLLGGFVIYIILKTFLGTEVKFWNFKKQQKTLSKKIIYEDDDIDEIDLEGLLQTAINNKQYRLAIRYYYLSILKGLSDNNQIEYHKDKTNSEYQLEIKNKTTRVQFSYLSYVYSYVWYGEFAIDETNFKQVEKKYQSFKTNLK